MRHKVMGYIDYIVDMLSSLENIRSRKMFSGYGIYKDKIFFALVLNDVLYFKTSESDRPTYQSYGSEPFSYTKKNGQQVAMSYWQVPVDIIENQNKLIDWARRAMHAATQSKIKKIIPIPDQRVKKN